VTVIGDSPISGPCPGSSPWSASRDLLRAHLGANCAEKRRREYLVREVPMFSFSESMDFDWPAHIVWSYLIAFEDVPLWEEGVLEVRQVDPGDVVVGTRVIARRSYGGRVEQVQGEIVELVPGLSATMALHGGPIDSGRATYAVEPIDGAGSRVTYTGSGRLRGAARLAGPLVPFLGRRATGRNLERLQRRIAATTRGPG
jgi:hypothetical protein